MEAVATELLQEKLDDYDKKCRDHFTSLNGWQDFWREGLKRGIDIPYNAHADTYNRYVNIAQYSDTLDEDTRSYPLDTEATIKMFARIVRWAKEKGWTVTKNYGDDEFTLRVENIPQPIGYVEFYSTRQVVCRRVLVGQEVVPAKTVDKYEYQCDKVAFLNVEV